MSDNIEVPLNLPDVRVIRSERTQEGHFLVYVESTCHTGICRKCKQEISEFHGHDEAIRLRHLDVLEHRLYIVIQPKRFVCRTCDGHPTTTQRCDWYKPRSPFTKAFERFLLKELIGSTVSDVVRKNGVGEKAVLGVLKRWISVPVHMANLAPFDTIGIDEISRRKGYKDFLAIITAYNSKTGELTPLGLLPDRTKSTVKKFLRKIPEQIRLKIETACIDLNIGFKNAVKAVMPHVKITADRFHVAKLYRKGVDAFRKKEQRDLKKRVSAEDYKKVKGALHPFRKDDTNLEKSKPLQELFKNCPELEKAHAYRLEMTRIFNTAPSKETGTNLIAKLLEKAKASGLNCFDKFAGTFEKWKDEITNYFISHSNSGFVEGFNNALKSLKRRCFGFLNHERFLRRLILDRNGYELLSIT